MYDFVDRPVTSLDQGGRFLIWAMRSWVRVIGAGNCPPPAIAPAFAKWRMISGLLPFHRAMLILNRDALESVGFCPLCCNQISEHEAIILTLVMAIGDGELHGPRDTLRLLIAEETVGDMLAALDELAAAMQAARIGLGKPATAPGRSREDKGLKGHGLESIRFR